MKSKKNRQKLLLLLFCTLGFAYCTKKTDDQLGQDKVEKSAFNKKTSSGTYIGKLSTGTNMLTYSYDSIGTTLTIATSSISPSSSDKEMMSFY